MSSGLAGQKRPARSYSMHLGISLEIARRVFFGTQRDGVKKISLPTRPFSNLCTSDQVVGNYRADVALQRVNMNWITTRLSLTEVGVKWTC